MTVTTEGNVETTGDAIKAISVGDSLLCDVSDDQPLPFDMRLSQLRANGRSGSVRSESDVLGKNFGRGGEYCFLVHFCNGLKRGQCPT